MIHMGNLFYRRKATNACGGRRWSKVHFLQRPEFIGKCALGTRSLLSFLFPFLGDRGFLSTRVEIFAATDFVLVEAAGFWAATPEESAEVCFDSELRLSILEPDFFTEVGESILLSPVCVDESFFLTFKAEA